MHHQEILDRIHEIEIFFNYLGLEKKHDFPKNWNLDSTIKYTPKDFNFIINYKGQNRILTSIDIGIVSGIIFTFIGNYKSEEVRTDYFFNHKYNDYQFLKGEWREYKLNHLLHNL